MNNFFSIVVPGYNCEKYVEKCLSSIHLQSYQNYENRIVDKIINI